MEQGRRGRAVHNRRSFRRSGRGISRPDPHVDVGQNQDLPFSGDGARCYQGFARTRSCASTTSRVLRAVREPVPRDGAQPLSVLDASAPETYEAALINFGVGTKPKTRGPARVRRRQLAERHAERRLQLRLPGCRPPRLRPEDDDDPRVRAPLVDEPPARRVRLRPRAAATRRRAPTRRVFDYGPGGATQFAWLGDMSDSIMSYLDLRRTSASSTRTTPPATMRRATRRSRTRRDGHPRGTRPERSRRSLEGAQDASRRTTTGRRSRRQRPRTTTSSACGRRERRGRGRPPSTWLIAGPIKPGNGNKNQQAARLRQGSRTSATTSSACTRSRTRDEEVGPVG